MDFAVYLNALTGLFVIVDPIGAALIFHSLVPEGEKRHRKIMALKAILISSLLLTIFGNYGEALLHQLGISIESLRIAGGLLLFYTAFNMITKDSEYEDATEKKDISVFPMSIPLLAGPGALTLSILLFSNAPTVQGNISVLVAIFTVYLLTLILMFLSGYLKKVIGRTGDEILSRFLGVLLAALSIQFIYDGISNITG
jgi:multiple antibiotic resistance protein